MAHSNDDAVQQKMEEMKRKNQELMQRHAEIEMDKKNAEEYSRAVKAKKISNPVKVATRIPATRSARPKLPPDIPPQDIEEKRSHRLIESSDGPPPDPKYSFLSDPSRKRTHSDWTEGQTKSSGVHDRTSRGQSHRHPNNYGGTDFENVRPTMEKQRSTGLPAQTSDRTLTMTGKQRIQYDRWKREREQVDQERIERQRTTKGWIREWDSDKYPSLQDLDAIPRMPEFRRSSNEFSEKIPFHEPLSPHKTNANQSTSDLQVKGILKASSLSKANEETVSNSPMTRDPARTSKSPKRAPARVGVAQRPKAHASSANAKDQTPGRYLVKPNIAYLPGFGDVLLKPLYPGWKPGTVRNDRETLSKELKVLLKDPGPSHSEDVSSLMENLRLNQATNVKANLPNVTVVLSAQGKLCALDNQKTVQLNCHEDEIYESDNPSDSDALNQSRDSNIYKSDEEDEWEDCSGDEEDVVAVDVQPVAAELSFSHHPEDSGILTDVSGVSSLANISANYPHEQR